MVILLGLIMVIAICSSCFVTMCFIRYFIFQRYRSVESIVASSLQIMEDGRPWLDMAHVVSCLNKLDSGLNEKVCLMSRDEQNVLVVSFAELRNCLDQSFTECVQAHRTSSSVSNSASSVSLGAGPGVYN